MKKVINVAKVMAVIIDIIGLIIILIGLFLGGAYYGMHTSNYRKTEFQKQLEAAMEPLQDVVFPVMDGLAEAVEAYHS